ncbi:MAG: hypothetical protein R3F48_04080 [Candidatus Zixiibacteriota bacterium]
MKKTLILTVLVAFLLGSFAFATETRVATMGYVNNIVKDDANIWMYPSTINYYPNQFGAEFDGNDFYEAGAHFRFNEDNPWVLGAYFSTDDYYHSILDYYYATKAVSPYADQRIHLFYGRNLNEMPFAVAIGYYADSYKNEDTTTANNEETSLKRFEIGFGLSPMQGKLDLGLGISMTTWTDKDYYNGTVGVVDMTKPKGNMEFALTGRYWMDPIGKAVFVPHGALYYEKQGIELYGYNGTAWVLGSTITDKEFVIDLGLGMNYEASEDVLLVTDFGIMLESYKTEVDYADAAATDTESKDKYTTLPYFKIGIDAKVFKWMDLRAGVSSYWVSETWEPNDVTKRKWGWGANDTYFGLGFHWGDLELDAWVDTDFVENGPYFISGDETSSMFERVSLTYYFD